MGVGRVLGAIALLGGAAAQAVNTTLPIVDLGYELHQASTFNVTGNFYNFSNIRYAAPPKRFEAPEVPAENRSYVQTGNVGRICPQAAPVWAANAQKWIVELITGSPDNTIRPYTPQGAKWILPVKAQDPRASEDCLFLDVFVPAQILNAAGKGKGAPVMVWIYGGGYVGGNKYNNPAGLLASSGTVSKGEVIYVALNYRLGAMGFSSGPTFQSEGGISNAGLLDQRFALEWVQKYIHLFGGDPSQVTVFGESAGGGSIMHQITAYGGQKGSVPFQRAIPQSPGWIQASSNQQQEDLYQMLLGITNSTSLKDLKALSEADFIKANSLMVTYNATYGGFTYGPVVDGSFVPAQPGQLLAQGKFDKNVGVMVGHNAKEGTYFTPPYVNSTEWIRTQLRSSFPYISDSTLDYITNTLYPAVFDGSYPYTDEYSRATLIVSESVFTCNTYFLSRAYANKTYSYLFSVPPAFHGFDVLYTYYDGGFVSSNPAFVTNRTIAIALQNFITSFAKTGTPVAKGVRKFEMYGPDAQVLELDVSGIREVRDSNANVRCDWWQKGQLS
ncbi:carboxylesterase family protein-like protein [Polyplosphaeria fusca]|uniref:Carboxylic ester hydrolase n=1 Tax=Polyplosphaeria fusca TaxID=682080 RepID=A0A9P4UVX5_9PLEO|nr:carboxylesterase family protein-like protein [Polyplosphaeria fusca]